jgi:hypothetical protein
MYPAINHEMSKARAAFFYEVAQRDALGRVAREGRRARKNKSARPAPRFPLAAARRVLTALGAHP